MPFRITRGGVVMMNDQELHALGKEFEERVKARTAETPAARKQHRDAADQWVEAGRQASQDDRDMSGEA